jgi:SagB-type dehydrogenase family enzyme
VTSLKRIGLAIVVVAATLAGLSVADLRQDSTPLPKAATAGGMSLTEALAKRRSCSSYADRPLTPAQLGQLCWAAQGITEPLRGLRTAPSAMALYAIRVYIVDAAGLREYMPKGHLLRTLRTDNVFADLRVAIGKPAGLGGAPAAMVVAMHLAPMEERAGARAERYALLEAGHVAQNVLLQATALGLGSVPVGGLDEAKVAAALGLPDGIRPVYVLPLGTPNA